MMAVSPVPCLSDVSLFTREWIEIIFFSGIGFLPDVSLFTREWIEILQLIVLSDSLVRLPLYEGVD